MARMMSAIGRPEARIEMIVKPLKASTAQLPSMER
jgi:hypothetical protein